MKKNWPVLVILGLAACGCELIWDVDPAVFHGAVEPECAGKLEGTPLAAQTPGDCVVQVCDGHGHARVNLSLADVADDGNPCTKDECKNQETVHVPLKGEMAAEQVVGDCLVKQCNAEGVVVDVPDDMDTGETVECSTISCANGVKMTQNAQPGDWCGADNASECNGDGVCVNWCGGRFGFPGEALQFVGPHYVGAATGDVDNDGKLDLVFVDYNATSFRVMRGTDDGKFAAPVVYVSGYWAGSVALADLDGKDGLDVVIAERFQGTTSDPGGVHVYLNNGNGTFGTNARYTTGMYANDVVAADLNGDGMIDMAVANLHNENVSVLLNQGGGTFGPVVNYDVGAGPFSLVAADLDGVTGADLAVASHLSNGVSVLKNQGDGTFANPIHYDVGAQLVSIDAADLNGDTKLDLVVTTHTGNTVGVMMNQGGAVFSAPIKYPTGKNAYDVTTADLNGDSHLDIAAANYTDGTVSTLLGNGKGEFAEATNYAMGSHVAEVVAADFTGDGAPDLVASNGTGYLRMLVNENNGKGTFHVDAPHYKTGIRPTSIAARDFNGDNVPDLAVTNFHDNTVSILQNEGKGTVTSVDKPVIPGHPSTVVSDDFDGDGDFDLAVSESERGYVAVLINETIKPGNAVFAKPIEYASGAANADAVASSDVDGDGDFDLLVAHGNGPGGGTLGVLLNQGNGTFAAPVTIPVGDQNAFTKRATLGVADLNDDAKPDVVVGRLDSTYMYLLLNDGNGSFVYANSFDTSNGISFFAIADLDGDSRQDVVVNLTKIMENSGGPNPTFSMLTYHTYNVGTVAVADVNGDNKPDMVEANSYGAELNVFMNDGKGVFQPAKHYAAGVHESYNGSIVATDLNVDGRPDLAVVDDEGVSIYLSTCMP